MTSLNLSSKIRTGAVMRAVPDFARILRRERQYNLLRVIGELPRARSTPWLTICRIAGLTEIEIRLLNDLLRKAAAGSGQAA